MNAVSPKKTGSQAPNFRCLEIPDLLLFTACWGGGEIAQTNRGILFPGTHQILNFFGLDGNGGHQIFNAILND